VGCCVKSDLISEVSTGEGPESWQRCVWQTARALPTNSKRDDETPGPDSVGVPSSNSHELIVESGENTRHPHNYTSYIAIHEYVSTCTGF